MQITLRSLRRRALFKMRVDGLPRLKIDLGFAERPFDFRRAGDAIRAESPFRRQAMFWCVGAVDDQSTWNICRRLTAPYGIHWLDEARNVARDATEEIGNAGFVATSCAFQNAGRWTAEIQD